MSKQTPQHKLKKRLGNLSRQVTKLNQAMRVLPMALQRTFQPLLQDMQVMAGSQALLIDVLAKADPELPDKLKAELEKQQEAYKAAAEAKKQEQPGETIHSVGE